MIKKILKKKKAAEKNLQKAGKKLRAKLEGSKAKAVANMKAGVRY